MYVSFIPPLFKLLAPTHIPTHMRGIITLWLYVSSSPYILLLYFVFFSRSFSSSFLFLILLLLLPLLLTCFAHCGCLLCRCGTSAAAERRAARDVA